MKKIIIVSLTVFALCLYYASSTIITTNIIIGVVGIILASIFIGLDVLCLTSDVIIIKPEDYIK